MSTATMTLLELRNATRQRADMVNSNFVTDSELNSFINQSYFELYDLMVQKYGNDYFCASPYSITTDGTDSANLPTDFYKLLGADLQLANGQWTSLKSFNFAERNKYSFPSIQTYYGASNLRYRIRGSKIWLIPTPPSGQVIRLWYVPQLTQLSADSDTCDGVSGWTEYIIVDAAIKCGAKEESDVSVLMAQKQGLIQRIEAAAQNRDVANAQTVSDVNSYDQWMPVGGGNY